MFFPAIKIGLDSSLTRARSSRISSSSSATRMLFVEPSGSGISIASSARKSAIAARMASPSGSGSPSGAAGFANADRSPISLLSERSGFFAMPSEYPVFCDWDSRPAVAFSSTEALALLEPGGPWVSVDALNVAWAGAVLGSAEALSERFQKTFGPLDVPAAFSKDGSASAMAAE